MQSLIGKVTGSALSAAEWNQLPGEVQNVIEDVGQTLSSGDLNQLGKAIAGYAGNGSFYIDSGSANSYVLATVGSQQAPSDYAIGQRIRFIVGVTNTGASTANVASLGVKAIEFFGNALVGGELRANSLAEAEYDGTAFQIIPFAGERDYAVLRSGRRNEFINGNFEEWQRGITSTLSGYDSNDQWLDVNNGTTKVHSQQAHTVGQTTVPGNPEFYSRTVVTSVAGAANNCLKQQRVENVMGSSGKTKILSFWAKADAAKDIAISALQNFGTGGSPSADVTDISVQKITLTSGWAYYTATISFPSISGKTLGTTNKGFYEVSVWFDAGSDFNSSTDTLGQQSGTFEMDQFQLENGTVATPFEFQSPDEVFAECQRYFQKSYNNNVDPGTVTTVGTLGFRAPGIASQQFVIFPVPMWAAPVVTIYNPNSGATGTVRNFSGVSDDPAGPIFESKNGFTIDVTGTVDLSALGAHYTAESTL